MVSRFDPSVQPMRPKSRSISMTKLIALALSTAIIALPSAANARDAS